MSDAELLKAVGRRIREARMGLGMSQRTLAVEALTTDAHVSDWEHGRRDPGVCGLVRVSGALGVPVRSLLGGDAGP